MDGFISIDGLNLHYVCDGIGEDIILLHGWGQNYHCFDKVIEYLKKDYRVWAIDFPGFGESDEPNTDFTVYDYEKVLSDFIQKKEIVNPVIVGHSFGCRVATIYASKKNNIRALVFTGAAGIKGKHDFKTKLKILNYKLMKQLVKTPLYSHYKDDVLQNSGSEDYKRASDVMKKVLIKTVNEDLTYLLDKIDVDTLLYWGEKDTATPLENAYKMNELIQQSKLIIKKEGTHYAFLENIDNFNHEIKQFLKKKPKM